MTRKGHGRLETRTITVSSQLKDFLDWPYPDQVLKLERRFVSLTIVEIQEQIEYGFQPDAGRKCSPQLLDKIRFWGALKMACIIAELTLTSINATVLLEQGRFLHIT